MCNAWPYGSQQTPINIDLPTTIPALFPRDYLVVAYPDKDMPGEIKKHDFWFDGADPDPDRDTRPELIFEGRKIFLERVHIHDKSEHTVNKRKFDLELHFVHMLPDEIEHPNAPTGPSIAVVLGVFCVEKKARTGAKKRAGGRKPPMKINPRRLMPANTADFFRYEGSLTTPSEATGLYPERIHWFVFPQVLEVDPQDIALLRKYQIHDREVQQLNRRFVLRSFV